MRTYRIPVCPECSDGPLAFFDCSDEGMADRTQCSNGHVVIHGKERRLEVMERLSMCFCGTSDAYRCPLHVSPRS